MCEARFGMRRFMDLGLSRKKGIACAASKGLGRAVAVALAREGVDLVIMRGARMRLKRRLNRYVRRTTSTLFRLLPTLRRKRGERLCLRPVRTRTF
jgi:NAD(P)-dependent dehydrogenase (short-subunit alcohol dehydrogenase family)